MPDFEKGKPITDEEAFLARAIEVSKRAEEEEARERHKKVKQLPSSNLLPDPANPFSHDADFQRIILEMRDSVHIPDNTKLRLSAAAAAANQQETARARYQKFQRVKLDKSKEVLMSLGETAMVQIRGEFEKRGWALRLSEFVKVVQQCAPDEAGSEEDLNALVEIFDDVNVNGDSEMSWDEFTAYWVEMASTTIDKSGDLHMFDYNRAAEDTSRHDYPAESIKYFPDADVVVLFEHKSSRMRLYDPDLRCENIIRAHRGPISSADIMTKHQLMVTASADSTIAFWDMTPGKPFTKKNSFSTSSPQVCVAFFGNTLYTGDPQGVISAWSIEYSEIKRTMNYHKDTVMELLPLTSLGFLASSSLDKTVVVWDVNRGAPRGLCIGHEKGVVHLAFCGTRDLLATGGMDSYVLVWRLDKIDPKLSDEESCEKLFSVHQLFYRLQNTKKADTHTVGLAFTPRTADMDERLVTCSNHGQFRVYEALYFDCVQKLDLSKSGLSRVCAFTYVPPILYDQTPIDTLDGEIYGAKAVAKQGGRPGCVIIAGDKLHKLDQKITESPELAHEGPVVWAAYNHISLTFMTASGHSLKVWSALTGILEREQRNIIPNNISSGCFDERMRRCFLGDDKGAIKVFNCTSFAHMKDLDPHTREVSVIRYATHHTKSSETSKIFSGSWDRRFISHKDLFDDKGAAGGGALNESISSAVRIHREHTSDIVDIAFSVSLKMMASAASNGQIIVYKDGLKQVYDRIQVPFGVTCMTFIGVYPLLCVGDQAGQILLYALDVDFKWHLLLRQRNNPPAADPRPPVEEMKRLSRLAGIVEITEKEETLEQTFRTRFENGGPDDQDDEDEGDADADADKDKDDDWDEIAYRRAKMGSRPFTNNKVKMGTDVVSMMVFDPDTESLFACDSGGHIKKWYFGSLLCFFHELQSGEDVLKKDEAAAKAQALRKPHRSQNKAAVLLVHKWKQGMNIVRAADTLISNVVQRKKETDKIEAAKIMKQYQGAVLQGPTRSHHLVFPASHVKGYPFASSLKIETEYVIKAHVDSVKGVQLMTQGVVTPTLLSWCFNGSVKIWAADTGALLGMLTQAHNMRNVIRNPNDPWHFYPDFRKHQQHEHTLMLRALAGADAIEVAPCTRKIGEFLVPTMPVEDKGVKDVAMLQDMKDLHSGHETHQGYEQWRHHNPKMVPQQSGSLVKARVHDPPRGEQSKRQKEIESLNHLNDAQKRKAERLFGVMEDITSMAEKQKQIKQEMSNDSLRRQMEELAKAKQEEDENTIVLTIKISCRDLVKNDMMSESDPICVCYLNDPLVDTYEFLGQSEAIMDTQDPNFEKTWELRHDKRKRRALRLEVYDVDEKEEDGWKVDEEGQLGDVEIPLVQLVKDWRSGKKTELLLQNVPKGLVVVSVINIKRATGDDGAPMKKKAGTIVNPENRTDARSRQGPLQQGKSNSVVQGNGLPSLLPVNMVPPSQTAPRATLAVAQSLTLKKVSTLSATSENLAFIPGAAVILNGKSLRKSFTTPSLTRKISQAMIAAQKEKDNGYRPPITSYHPARVNLETQGRTRGFLSRPSPVAHYLNRKDMTHVLERLETPKFTERNFVGLARRSNFETVQRVEFETLTETNVAVCLAKDPLGMVKDPFGMVEISQSNYPTEPFLPTLVKDSNREKVKHHSVASHVVASTQPRK